MHCFSSAAMSQGTLVVADIGYIFTHAATWKLFTLATNGFEQHASIAEFLIPPILELQTEASRIFFNRIAHMNPSTHLTVTNNIARVNSLQPEI